jgi:hypothetical protein
MNETVEPDPHAPLVETPPAEDDDTDGSDGSEQPEQDDSEEKDEAE